MNHKYKNLRNAQYVATSRAKGFRSSPLPSEGDRKPLAREDEYVVSNTKMLKPINSNIPINS